MMEMETMGRIGPGFEEQTDQRLFGGRIGLGGPCMDGKDVTTFPFAMITPGCTGAAHGIAPSRTGRGEEQKLSRGHRRAIREVLHILHAGGTYRITHPSDIELNITTVETSLLPPRHKCHGLSLSNPINATGRT